MNASNSLTISIADPIRVAEAPGQRSPVRSGSENGEAFNAVYDNEARETHKDRQNNSINNNMLKKEKAADAKTADSMKDSAGTSDDDHRSVDEGPSRSEQLVDMAGAKAVVDDEDSLTIDELLVDEPPIAMLDAPLSTDENTVLKGEMLPPGGKNLPLIARDALKEALGNDRTAGDEDESLLKETAGQQERVLSRLGNQEQNIQGLTRSHSSELQNPENFSSLFNSNSDQFDSDKSFNLNSDKSAGESILERITSLTGNGVKELVQPAPQVTSSTNTSAITTGIDSSVASIQSLSSAEHIETTLNIRGNSTDWSQAIGDKVRWMQNAKVSTAELHLNPAELGSIEIKIVTEDQQARVQFITSSAAAQEMIEESMSKLKDLLGDHGIALDQSDVSQRDDRKNEFAQETASSSVAETDIDQGTVQEAALATTASTNSRIGQIDQYV